MTPQKGGFPSTPLPNPLRCNPVRFEDLLAEQMSGTIRSIQQRPTPATTKPLLSRRQTKFTELIEDKEMPQPPESVFSKPQGRSKMPSRAQSSADLTASDPKTFSDDSMTVNDLQMVATAPYETCEFPPVTAADLDTKRAKQKQRQIKISKPFDFQHIGQFSTLMSNAELPDTPEKVPALRRHSSHEPSPLLGSGLNQQISQRQTDHIASHPIDLVEEAKTAYERVGVLLNTLDVQRRDCESRLQGCLVQRLKTKGVKGALSRCNATLELRRAEMESLESNLQDIKAWGAQLVDANHVLMDMIQFAEHRTGKQRITTLSPCDLHVHWILKSTEEFLERLMHPAEILEAERESRRKSTTLSILSTWSEN